ncbi:hypothetical protein [Nocardia sp. NRRL WC-3656]|uniref:hypothetical protein n=1 Tax=Nocardia sp. NRRL WC-3656 TaxID=1463824 RepID=UPI0012DE9395|nr:hypothetical protein [Nocardia sp. NRRL WC-3656]
MLPASVLPGRAVLAYPRTITNQPRIKGGDYDEATYLTPDHHLCSECYDRYPIGSDEFFEALDWSERTLG